MPDLRAEDVLPFLRAVHDAPDDDLPRLVFADWLDERGDWRGPLLRRPAPADGCNDEPAAADWLARFGWMPHVSVHCRRGLLAVRLLGIDLLPRTIVPRLAEALRQGWVEHAAVGGASALDRRSAAVLAEVPSLTLYHLTDAELAGVLPALPRLRGLTLIGHHLTDGGLERLRNLPRLRRLRVGRCKVTPAGLSRLRLARAELAVEWDPWL
jgi:uncharacterized protein (TIGR02996 family)